MAPTCRYRFVDFGTRFQLCDKKDRTDAKTDPTTLYKNEIVTDVGSRCWLGPGDPFVVIDHHFTPQRFPSACAAVLHLAPKLWEEFHRQTREVWLVTHHQPDFDALCSQYLVKIVLESHTKPAYGMSSVKCGDVDSEERTGRTKIRNDWFHPALNRLGEDRPWQLKLANYASLVDSCERIQCPKSRSLHSVLYTALQRGRNYMDDKQGASEFFDEVRKKLANSNLDPAFDSVLEGSEVFAPELALLDHAVEAYARDVRRARKAIVYVSQANGDFEKVYEELVERPLMETGDEQIRLNEEHVKRWGQKREPADGIYIRDPECLLFKEWARLDTENSSLQKGFLLTAVAYSGERDRGVVNTTDYFFTLDPERAMPWKLHLYPVWAQLEAAELKALRSNLGEVLKRKGLEARKEFEKRALGNESLWHDPWFDGGNYACTLVATPNEGTLIGEPGKEAGLGDDPVTRIVRKELEYCIYSPTVHIHDFQTIPKEKKSGLQYARSEPFEADIEQDIPVDELGDLLRGVKEGRLRFARVGLHRDVDTGLGMAGREIGEWLWSLLHPNAKSVPPDFAETHLVIESDTVSVWSLNGVAVACKNDCSVADSNRARVHDLERTFAEVATLRRNAGFLLLHEDEQSVNSEGNAEEDLVRSEKRLAEFGKLHYELTLPENGILRQFFNAVRLGDILETVRDRHATIAEKRRADALRENTQRTAEVQSKVEWLEVLFVSFYSIEFVNVLLEHWHEPKMVLVIVLVGILFLGLAYVGLKPYETYKSGRLLLIVLVLMVVMAVACGLSFHYPGLFPLPKVESSHQELQPK